MTTPRLAGLAAAAALALAASLAQAQETGTGDGGDGGDGGDTTDARPAGDVSWSFGDQALSFVTASWEYDTLRSGSATITPDDPEATAPDAAKTMSIMASETVDGGAMLTLTLNFAADPARDGVVGYVEYAPDPSNPPLWVNGADGAAPVTVTIDSYAFDGTAGKVAGHFAGDLCKSADWDTAPDPRDCTAVKGSFSTEVYPGN